MAAQSTGRTTAEPLRLVERCKDAMGLDKIVLNETKGYRAEVYLYGAYVTAWERANADKNLFMSTKKTKWDPLPSRGGIQICFPDFGGSGSLEEHGFARTELWNVEDNPPPFQESHPYRAFVDLILRSTDAEGRARKFYNHNYEFRLRVALGPEGDLMLVSRIRNLNPNRKPFSFRFAYNAYFNVTDIEEVRVEGTEILDYIDNLKNKEMTNLENMTLTFDLDVEVDRIYVSGQEMIMIMDHAKRTTYVMRREGLPDIAAWTPGKKKAKQHFANKEYNRTVCMAAACAEKPIKLKPGQEWTGKMQLIFVPSAFNEAELLKFLTPPYLPPAGGSGSRTRCGISVAGVSSSHGGGTSVAGGGSSTRGGGISVARGSSDQSGSSRGGGSSSPSSSGLAVASGTAVSQDPGCSSSSGKTDAAGD